MSLTDLLKEYRSNTFVEFRKRGKDDTEKPQDRAYAYARQNGGLPVFGKHVNERNFHYVVSSWHYFYELYARMLPEERCYNEIIREGFPFNFYADCELYRNVNPEYQPGSAKEVELIHHAKHALMDTLVRCFPEQLKKDSIKVIDLDSSDENKLSRHFVFRIPNMALKNWETAAHIFENLLAHSNIEAHEILWVKNPKRSDNKIFFIDGSVYTKNRQFRMYQAKKFGNNNRFFHFPDFDEPGHNPNEEKFFESLVSYFPFDDRQTLTMLEIQGEIKKKKRTKKIPGAAEKPKTTTATPSRAINSQVLTSHWLADSLKRLFNNPVYKVQFEEGGTRLWLWIRSTECQISGKHKSNNIKFLFNLTAKTYTQRCNSMKCKGQSGPTQEIPAEYLPDVVRYLQERDTIFFSKIFEIN